MFGGMPAAPLRKRFPSWAHCGKFCRANNTSDSAPSPLSKACGHHAGTNNMSFGLMQFGIASVLSQTLPVPEYTI